MRERERERERKKHEKQRKKEQWRDKEGIRREWLWRQIGEAREREIEPPTSRHELTRSP